MNLAIPHADSWASIQEPPDTGIQWNFFARPRADAAFAWPLELSAWLDRSNRVISLPAEWDALAAASGHPDLERDRVLGRPVGWFITDESVRQCFRGLFDRIRQDGHAARLVARCDAESEPRAVQLRFTPSSAGALECRWSFFAGAIAERIAVCERRQFGDGEYLRMCGWCRRVRLDSLWQRLEAVAAEIGLLDSCPVPPITHGICPQCVAALQAENARAAHVALAV